MERKSIGIVITVDGPAGSGKSTTSKEVAKRLKYVHLDSGAMYRAATLHVLQSKMNIHDSDKIVNILREASIEFLLKDLSLSVMLNGSDVTYQLRSPQVTASISPIAANPKVRSILIEKQRALANDGGIIAEGRDMGSVVFPNAELKIYMDASLEERAKRRCDDFKRQGISVNFNDVLDKISIRDKKDTEREASPLKIAADAIILETTLMSFEEQVEFIICKAKERGA